VTKEELRSSTSPVWVSVRSTVVCEAGYGVIGMDLVADVVENLNRVKAARYYKSEAARRHARAKAIWPASP
jgi:hypothetical protein